MKLLVRVTPNAPRTEVIGWVGEEGACAIKLKSPPVEGAANRALVKFIAECVGVAKSRVTILRGERARIKLIEIDADETLVYSRLGLTS